MMSDSSLRKKSSTEVGKVSLIKNTALPCVLQFMFRIAISTANGKLRPSTEANYWSITHLIVFHCGRHTPNSIFHGTETYTPPRCSCGETRRIKEGGYLASKIAATEKRQSPSHHDFQMHDIVL